MWVLVHEDKAWQITSEDPTGLWGPGTIWVDIGSNPSGIQETWQAKKEGTQWKFSPYVPVLSPEELSSIERLWRDKELIRADYELSKVQDSDPKAIGTEAEWRDYRRALRNYPETSEFPSEAARPVSPT